MPWPCLTHGLCVPPLAGGSGIHRPVAKKTIPGAEYKAKVRAGGRGRAPLVGARGTNAHHHPKRYFLWSQREATPRGTQMSCGPGLCWVAISGCRSSWAPPEAENDRKGGHGLSHQGQGWKGKPTLPIDSVSLGEQKAKGDVKKKGRLDPYAYIPLNRTKLNHRYAVCRLGWHVLVALSTQLLKSLPVFYFYLFTCTFKYY